VALLLSWESTGSTLSSPLTAYLPLRDLRSLLLSFELSSLFYCLLLPLFLSEPGQQLPSI
jgi:hypothetical protein